MRQPIEEGVPKVRHEAGWFDGPDGLRLFEQRWLPAAALRASVVLVHGYAEHSSRYDHVGRWLVERGYAVHAFDLRGHGKSEGERVLVRSFAQHLDDLDAFVARARERTPGVPLFVLGHSMGGTIVALRGVTRRADADGVMLSGAVLTMRGRRTRLMTAVLALVGRIFPSLPLRKLDAGTVSRDPAVVAAYDADPLVFRGKMPAGTLSAMVRAVRAIEKRMEEAQGPLLIMHGTEDLLADPEGSRELYRRAPSGDKTLEMYEGLYHEILNEPEQGQVLADIARWLDARTG